jgi:hypothetical protein
MGTTMRILEIYSFLSKSLRVEGQVCRVVFKINPIQILWQIVVEIATVFLYDDTSSVYMGVATENMPEMAGTYTHVSNSAAFNWYAATHLSSPEGNCSRP